MFGYTKCFIFIAGTVFSMVASLSATAAPVTCPDTLNFNVRPLAAKQPVNLCKLYLGKVILIVNTASKCGFTPQYDGLESLYRQYKEQGLVILGFPSNDFGEQEPGNEKQIQAFCRLTYGVEFPMFEKTRVARHNADPLYRTLAEKAGEYPRWNFHKYLIDRRGKVVASFQSRIDPKSVSIVKTIESLL